MTPRALLHRVRLRSTNLTERRTCLKFPRPVLSYVRPLRLAVRLVVIPRRSLITLGVSPMWTEVLGSNLPTSMLSVPVSPITPLRESCPSFSPITEHSAAHGTLVCLESV